MPVILANWEAKIREVQGSRSPRQIGISKITRANWSAGMTQAIKLCKCKFLVQTPSPSKRKKSLQGKTGLLGY
jgi:hypothetical protein